MDPDDGRRLGSLLVGRAARPTGPARASAGQAREPLPGSGHPPFQGRATPLPLLCGRPGRCRWRLVRLLSADLCDAGRSREVAGGRRSRARDDLDPEAETIGRRQGHRHRRRPRCGGERREVDCAGVPGRPAVTAGPPLQAHPAVVRPDHLPRPVGGVPISQRAGQVHVAAVRHQPG